MSNFCTLSSVPDAMHSAQFGIGQGMTGLNTDAQMVAASVTGVDGGLTHALVDSLAQRLAVEASVRVLESADQVLGTLIDVTV